MASPLHWSFDYGHLRLQEHFVPELLETLRSGATAPRPGIARYVVLPNHWGGFAWRGEGKSEKIAYGHAVISTTEAGEGAETEVEYYHDGSGETLHLRYRTDGTAIRQLLGRWEVEAKNDGSGTYSTFTCSGEIRDERVRLKVGGFTLDAGTLEPGEPLICSWTLLETIAALAEFGKSFTVIDDLEKVKRNCRLKPMEDWVWEGRSYSGYALQGMGVGHTYYWVDENGRTAVMSNPFNTFVLGGGAA